MNRGASRTGIAGIAVFLLSYLLAAAGGLMIAPAVALFALIAFPVHREFWRPGSMTWFVMFGLAFLAWTGISFLWSPHDDPEQVPKLLLGVPLYVLFALRVGSLDGIWRARVEAAILFMVIGLGLMGIVEIVTDGSATRSFKLAVEGADALSARELDIYVNRNLGHAAAPLVMLAGPAALLAWREGGPVIGVFILLVSLVLAFSFDTQVNAVAFVLAGVAGLCAVYWPRSTVAMLIGGAAGLVMVTPFVLPGVIEVLPEDLVEQLPLSWKWRLEIWSFAGDLLEQGYLFGHGLDASRAINDTAVLDGYDIELLPLHPHNAALHIWLETGLVGAALLSATLVALGGRVSSAPRLSRIQAVAIAWVFTSYFSLVFFSYGVWQEWHQGAVALAVTATLFLGAHQKRADVD